MTTKRKMADYFLAEQQQPIKKFRRLERRVNALKPEMKHETFSIVTTLTSASPFAIANLTQISQGDAVSRRTGNKIKVWRIEIRGLCSSVIDSWVVQTHNSDAPVAAQFTAGFGSFVTDDDLNTKITEWRHYRNLNETANDAGYKLIVRFKTGINVHYDGITTTPASNGLYWVGYNAGASDRNVQLQARVWYTDV